MDDINKQVSQDNELKNTSIKTAVEQPLWFSVSETAKLLALSDKTIRRAIQSKNVIYKIVNKKYYLVEFGSAMEFALSQTKTRNKFLQSGIGQYFGN